MGAETPAIAGPIAARLGRDNAIAAAVHLLQAAAVLALAASFALPVAAYLQGPPGTPATDPEVLFDIPTGAAVAGVLALSAMAHLLVCTAWRSHYFADLARHRNQARWVEYSASSSLMIVLIAQLVGIADAAALLAFAPIAARLADSLPHAPMGTLVGGLVVMVNGVTALGGLPGWLDAVLLLLAGLITCTYARRAWALEKNSRSVSDHQLLSDS